MSSTRDQLRYFLTSQGRTEAQITQIEQDIATLADTSPTIDYGMTARYLMDTLTVEDTAPTFSGIHAAAAFTRAMQELLDPAKTTTQIDREHLKSGIQQLFDDNTIWCSYCEQDKPRAQCTLIAENIYICSDC